MDIFKIADTPDGLSAEEIKQQLVKSLEGRELKKVLILPPDFTRYHSNAGLLTNLYYHELTRRGAKVDIMPALGTHAPMTEAQLNEMSRTGFATAPNALFWSIFTIRSLIAIERPKPPAS